MFDVATRPQPSRNAADALGLPFDWRLTAPAPERSYRWVDYTGPSGFPQYYADTLRTYALELEDTLSTAVIVSLFTDRRAGADDVLPLNQTDRRGWVGDEFMAESFDARQDAWGSLLWLCYVTKATPDILERARFAAQEALAWLVRDGIASRVDVTTEWAGARLDVLAIRSTIYRPGEAAPVYDVLWGTSIRRAIA